MKDLPLLEFDDERSVIEPSEQVPPRDVPEAAVLCFFPEIVEAVCGHGKGKLIEHPGSVGMVHPLYVIDYQGTRLAVCFPGIGAPLATISLEDAIAYGCREFVACGVAGALVTDLGAGAVLVPTSAVRDEGTSFHYLPAGREVEADPDVTALTLDVLTTRGVTAVSGKVWTTDAPYRETKARVARRVAEGCLMVEMEAAALIAVARFRQVRLAYLLFAGDSLAGEAWDSRGFQKSTARQELFELAAQVAMKLITQ